MDSQIGWIEISSKALALLKSELYQSQGIVDEMGMLVIHRGYANRFFPGTSVLHTRPRYLFFTCWNYLAVLKGNRKDQKPFEARMDEAEWWVTRHLLDNEANKKPGSGVVGGENFKHWQGNPKRSPAEFYPVQPASFAYWSALAAFGFYRGVPRSVLADVARTGRFERFSPDKDFRDDDPGGDAAAIFCVPPILENWQKKKDASPLSLELEGPEAEMLRQRLQRLRAPGYISTPGPARPALLAGLAERASEFSGRASNCWDDPLVKEVALRTYP